MIPRTAVVAGLLLASLATPARGQSQGDEAALRHTLTAYIQSMYEGNVDTLKASVHKDTRKIGIVRPEGEADYRRLNTDRGDMEQYARAVGRGGGQPGDRTQEIVILDVQDRTAVAKLTVTWGTEYVLVAKEKDRWEIVGILWRSTQD